MSRFTLAGASLFAAVVAILAGLLALIAGDTRGTVICIVTAVACLVAAAGILGGVR